MNTKLKKFLIVNIAIILVICVIAEIVAFYSYRNRYSELISNQANLFDNPQEVIKENTPHYLFPRKFDYSIFEERMKFRIFKTENPKKRPIVTIGCSYTEGAGLENNQTFASKLNKLTGRTTYNRGISGTGPQLVYRQLIDKDFKKDVPDAEYVIYTFIHHHLYRQFQTMLCSYTSEINLQYSLKNGKLTEKSHPFWFMYWSFLLKTYFEYKTNVLYGQEFSQDLPMFLCFLKNSVDKMHELYPDSKFVLVEFPQSDLCLDNYEEGMYELTPENIKMIEDLGIIYINASKLVGHRFCEKKYRLPDNDHPSETTWDELTPKIVEKLGL